jgi:hypothetical protein
MSNYLRQQKIVEDTINFDGVHRTLVLQHAYLTNGTSDFVLSLGPATMNAINRIEEYFDKNQTAGYKYDCAEIKQYVEHMQVRASTEMQHRQRMLDRITMYLQVVSLRLTKPPTRLTLRGYILTQKAIQSYAATDRTRDEARLLGHEKHLPIDNGLLACHCYSCEHT